MALSNYNIQKFKHDHIGQITDIDNQVIKQHLLNGKIFLVLNPLLCGRQTPLNAVFIPFVWKFGISLPLTNNSSVMEVS